jgi:hypothetical protein
MGNLRLSVGRFALAAVTALFLMIGSKFVIDPSGAVTQSGLTVLAPYGATNLRASFGAFPIGCALFMASCLFAARRVPEGLDLGACLVGTALVVRVYGAWLDHTWAESLRLIAIEAIVLVIVLAANMWVPRTPTG